MPGFKLSFRDPSGTRVSPHRHRDGSCSRSLPLEGTAGAPETISAAFVATASANLSFICNYFLTPALRHRSRPPNPPLQPREHRRPRSGMSGRDKKGGGGGSGDAPASGTEGFKRAGAPPEAIEVGRGMGPTALRQPGPAWPRIFEQIVHLVTQQLEVTGDFQRIKGEL